MVVASSERIFWQMTLDEGADTYVATLRSPESYQPFAFARLPRSTVDDVVLGGARIVLELAPDGRIAAYTENSGLRTLASAALSELVAHAVSHDALRAEEDPGALERPQAELLQVLGFVRAAHLVDTTPECPE